MPDPRPALATIAALASAFAGPALAGEPDVACLPGRYDGGQHEVAAGLELVPDGRFDYGLSYGGLDEIATGQWRFEQGNVLLTSDPVVPPRFTLVGEARGRRGLLKIALDVPKGISRQYFDARVQLADGRTIERQFAEDGLTLELDRGDQAVSVTVLLAMFGLESEAFALSGAGEARIRFEPNDLGKVGFVDTPLAIKEGVLLLERHGRLLRFRAVKGGCARDQAP